MRIDLRPRSFGELLGLVFSLSGAHLGKLFVVALAVVIPTTIAEHYQRGLDPQKDAGTILGLGLLILLFGLIAWPLLSAASIKIVASSFTGARASLADGVATGLRRLGTLLGVSLSVGLLVTLGSVLFIVPGLMWMMTYYVAACPVVLEDRGVGAAMDRSKQLTRGHRWTMFGLFAITSILMQIVPAFALQFVEEMGLHGIGLSAIRTLAMAALSVPGMIAPVVAFFDLRVRKEGLDVVSLTELVDRIGTTIGKRASA